MIGKQKPKAEKALGQQYFEEAARWDSDIVQMTKKSERRAWWVAITMAVITALLAVGLTALLPLKSVEPFVIRQNTDTGLTEVVTVLKEEQEIEAEEALHKMWLASYLRHREAYLYDTREHDRYMVGLLSAPAVQTRYAEYSDPRKNPSAPITVYGQNAEVETKIRGMSMINPGEKVDGETRYTALVRYTKQVHRAGETTPPTHWAATITFTYRNAPMSESDRWKNPLGFQVLSYRNDEETGGM